MGGRTEGENNTPPAVPRKLKNSMIKFLFMNADSIMNKIDLLQAHVYELEPDIIAITESWTHVEIPDGILKIQGYDLIGRRDRKDTLKGRGGGVLLYSKLPTVRRGVSTLPFL